MQLQSKSRFLADDAVYQRTRAGQRELLVPVLPIGALTRRFLASVNGYTPLRALFDLGAPPLSGDDLLHLVEAGLIELRTEQADALSLLRAAQQRAHREFRSDVRR